MGTGELFFLGQPNKMPRVTWRWTCIPHRGRRNTPSRLHATETEISSSSVRQFGPSAALPLPSVISHPLWFSACMQYSYSALQPRYLSQSKQGICYV